MVEASLYECKLQICLYTAISSRAHGERKVVQAVVFLLMVTNR
jgi:hypothetical protein